MSADGGESILGRLADQIEVNRSVISDRCECSAEGQLEEGIAPQVVVAVTGILPRDPRSPTSTTTAFMTPIEARRGEMTRPGFVTRR